MAVKSQLKSAVRFLMATLLAASVSKPFPSVEFKVFIVPLYPNKRSGPAVEIKPDESVSVSEPAISPLLSTIIIPFTFKVSFE